MICRGLTGGVRRARIAGRLLREESLLSEFPIHFIGRHVEEAKAVLLLGRQIGPVGPCCFQKGIRSEDVGADKRRRAVDRAVDVRLRREVKDSVGLVLLEKIIHPVGVGNVHRLEIMPVTMSHRVQIGPMSGVLRASTVTTFAVAALRPDNLLISPLPDKFPFFNLQNLVAPFECLRTMRNHENCLLTRQLIDRLHDLAFRGRVH